MHSQADALKKLNHLPTSRGILLSCSDCNSPVELTSSKIIIVKKIYDQKGAPFKLKYINEFKYMAFFEFKFYFFKS